MSVLNVGRIHRVVGAFIGKRRPPARLRSQVDYTFRFQNRSVELIEVRPPYFKSDSDTESPFAKATHVKSRGIWKVYWMRANLKWYPYEPHAVRSLAAFLRLVDEDSNGCFFG